MRRNLEIDDDDIDENGVIRDGGRVRVPLNFMDSTHRALHQESSRPMFDAAAHQPGYRSRSAMFDAQARERSRYDDGYRLGSYAAYCQRLADAWRGGDAAEPDLQTALPPGARAPTAAPDSAYEEFKRNLANAWRSPHGSNPNAATAIERRAEVWRHGR